MAKINEGSTPTGKAKKHSSTMSKIGVTVALKQVVWIDRLCTSILENTENALDRGTVIRAILAGIEVSSLDLSHCATEEDIVNMIEKNIQAK